MHSPLAFYLGLLIVIATHTHMLVVLMPSSQQTYHAYINLAAAALMFYGAR
jgi:hypothetical protein